MSMSACFAPRFKSESVLLPPPRYNRFSLTATDIRMCPLGLLAATTAHMSCLSATIAAHCRSFIGTAPEARGRGLGSRLLAEITSRADREGRWCLLEATSEKSEVGDRGGGRGHTRIALAFLVAAPD